MSRLLLPALLLLIASGCDGPVGAIDRENGVTAELTAEGIRVTNEFDEGIYVIAVGEEALETFDPASQTVLNPGRPLPVGETILIRFDEDSRIQRSDDRFIVSWITVKGSAENPVIGPRGQLELQR